MHRRFKRRLAALDPHHEGEELIAALAVIRETGNAPPTRAGERAAELWKSVCRERQADMMRLLSFQLRAMGMSLSEFLRSDDSEPRVVR